MTPFESALDTISARRVILFGGKGGVGKTTLSGVAAQHFAASRRVIRFSSDPANEDFRAGDLWSEFLKKNLDAFLEIGDRGTYLDREELRRFFELSLPGVDELMAWMRIGELAEEQSDALIVVDTAPTGHTLRMLSSAVHFQQIGEALDAMQEKHRSLVRQLTRRDVRDAMDAFIAEFTAQAERRHALLTDPERAAFIPVMLSEPWVVEQTKRLVAEMEIDVPFVVLNRTVPESCHCAKCEEQRRRDAEAMKAFPRVVPFPFSPPAAPISPAVPTTVPLSPQAGRGARGEGPRITFFAGKGGVGKTTLSSSYALHLATSNPELHYVIISVDPAHSLRDVFASEKPPENLTVEIIDTKAKWRQFRDSMGNEIENAVNAITPKGLSIAYDTDALQKLIEIAPPGADELFAITRLADLLGDATIKGIVVDTAPTGHFLRLLDLPKSAGEWVREFMRILLRYRDLIPPGSLGEELVNASKALKLVEETLHRDASVMLVTRPESAVVSETLRLASELAARDIRIGGIIANYVTPDSDCKSDQSMRKFEEELLAQLPDAMRIERRDHPVTSLEELRTLQSWP